MTGANIADRPQELAQESRFQLLTRLGFAGRGLLYVLIAFLAIGTGRTEDLTGALEYLGQGIGRVLLIGIAAGMATYGVWRLADAAFGMENPGNDGKALRKRAAAGFIGVIYLYLSYKAVTILIAGHVDASSTHSIAVLPFKNISSDPDNEYFCEGLAEELINALNKIRELKVARTGRSLVKVNAFSFDPSAVHATTWLSRPQVTIRPS